MANENATETETVVGNGSVAEGKAEAAQPKEKARSETAYPYYDLANAVGIVEAVRRAGGREASNADVMKEMKVVKAADRQWAYGIPGAALFGLIERIGRGDTGRIKVTDLGLRIVMASSPEAASAAKIAAFKKPELYASLLERFAGTVPTKEGLKNLLYTDYKIVESMAPIAAEAFIDSLKVAGLVDANNAVSVGEPASPASGAAGAAKESAPPATHVPENMQTLHVPADFVIYKCKIGQGRVINIPLPPRFTSSDVKRLHAFLATQVDDDDSDEGGAPM